MSLRPNTYPNQGFTTPLVRTAHFSGVIKIGEKLVMVLDGFNNPGYSGGPIYVSGSDGKLAVAGLIVGYRFESASHSSVFKRFPDGTEEIIPDTFVKANSGMIYAASIAYIDALAAAIESRNNKS